MQLKLPKHIRQEKKSKKIFFLHFEFIQIRFSILKLQFTCDTQRIRLSFFNFSLSPLAESKNRRIFAPAKPKGTIAQLVEQRTENPCVPGSIPGGTTQESTLIQ